MLRCLFIQELNINSTSNLPSEIRCKEIPVFFQTPQRGPALPWAHHLREGSEGAGAMGYGWQSWAGAPVARSPDGDSSHGDMEFHLAGGERA